MRSFRENSVNLRDTRIAYMLLLSIAFVCAVLGITATQLGTDLTESRLESCLESLTLCADALDSWRVSKTAEERYAASLRLENAAARLPSEVELEPIMSLADYMRMGTGADERVRAFADTFALLASIDYESETEARQIIAEALGKVGETFAVKVSEQASAKAPREDILEYSRGIVIKSIRGMLGGSASAVSPVLSADSSTWTAEMQNLRMSFSSSDGSLEGFVYIRIGDKPSDTVSTDERAGAALHLYTSTRRGAGAASAKALGEVCGYTVCEIRDGDELWRAAVDRSGRVWSLFKVKR